MELKTVKLFFGLFMIKKGFRGVYVVFNAPDWKLRNKMSFDDDVLLFWEWGLKNQVFSPTGDARGFIKKNRQWINARVQMSKDTSINQSINNDGHPYLQLRNMTLRKNVRNVRTAQVGCKSNE